MATEQFWGTGRRKTSVARVRIIPNGSGEFVVNKKPLDEYFDRPDHVTLARSPLNLVEKASSFDVFVNVRGGGISGQAGALSMG